MTEKDSLPTSWQQPEKQGIFGKLRSYAFAGILVIAPAAITIAILYQFVTWLDSLLTGFIPYQYRPETFIGVSIPGTGLIAGVLLVVIIGMLARNFFGRWLVGLGERIMHSIPGVGNIYGAVKQIVETVTSRNTDAFREVVLVEYPRKGIWAIAFVTGKTKGQVQKITDDELVNVFVPTTPNPTSGFLLFFPRKDLTTLDMTVEQGIKMVISGGIVTPTAAEGKAALKAKQV
ncbi:MAG: DUF502 domain-containing protein [Alphaproteobacteria bacterium]|nr:DUF502 domain-containing protein [Alphaproteobacteria bacterium]MDD9919203.1 DUF502 domain-containing protein [Alphaproteobacteria bacterium]